MIQIDQLTAKDVGRKVIYGRDDLPKQEGTLSSWNNTYIFVKFKGPNGEACQPADVSFVFEHCTISRKPVPVRYFVHDIDGDSADAVECTESQFMEAAGLISYERHTVYANGVDQICLTKMPTL